MYKHKVYDEGYDTFKDLDNSGQNPYDPITQHELFDAWEDGYMDAY